MAVQLSVTVRNAQLDSLETAVGVSPRLLIFSGSVAVNCAAADPSGLLATLILPADWMNAASNGSKAMLGTWSVAASGAGVAASFRIKDSTLATCHVQGSVGQGTGDLQLDNTNIATGQTVQVTGFTLSAGNA